MIAKGMATEWPTEEFKTLFETTRAGVVIPRALALDVCATLTELEITSADAILAMDPDMFEATVREHTEREVMVKISLRWFEGSRSQKKSVSLGLLASTSRSYKQGKAKKPADYESSGDEEDGDEAGSTMGGRFTSTRSERLAELDSKMTGMSPAALQALDASLHAGTVMGPEVVEGLAYATDIAYTDFARKLAKQPDVVTFPKILKEKDNEAYKDHMVGLIRQYNNEGMSAESALMTSTHTATEDIFENDVEGKFRYMKSVRGKYPGRAFPFSDGCDICLVVKQMKTSMGGGTRGDLAAMKTALDSSVSQIKQLRTDLGNLQVEVRGLKTKLPEGGGLSRAEKSAEWKKGVTCDYCGEKGHIQRECPKKKEEDKKESEKKD